MAIDIPSKTRCPYCQALGGYRLPRLGYERVLSYFTQKRPFRCERCGRKFWALVWGKHSS